MKTIFTTAAVVLIVYLYVDKFLFRGELAGLFRQGWRELLSTAKESLRALLHLTGKVSGGDLPQQPAAQDELFDDGLVVQKRYFQCPTMPLSAKPEKTVSDGSVSPTFTGASEVSGAEVLEWFSPSFPVSGLRKEESMRWEEPGFAAHFIQRDDQSTEVDLIEEIDTEQLRAEVAAFMEQIRDDELQDEFCPSNEEKYHLERFEAEAYR